VKAIDIVVGQMESQNKSAIEGIVSGVFYVQNLVASRHTAGTLIAAVLRKTKEPQSGSIP
jgi:hypothetical protein